jgi:hypothetical protein
MLRRDASYPVDAFLINHQVIVILGLDQSLRLRVE